MEEQIRSKRRKISHGIVRGSMGVRYGVSKRVEDNRKAVSGVASPQGVERLGMAGLAESLGSPWLPLHIRPCVEAAVDAQDNVGHGQVSSRKKSRFRFSTNICVLQVTVYLSFC
jgi:hypothetical protein